jgi:hypothetical protein
MASDTDDERAACKSGDFPAGFDEATYQQAKPHFEAALKSFQDAGKTMVDLFKMLIDQFGDGIKVYAVRYAKDQKLTLDLAQQDEAKLSATKSEKPEQEIQNQLVGHNRIFEALRQRDTLVAPYPSSDLTDDELADLVYRLDACMPRDFIIADLLNWDIRLYDGLGDDWYFEAVFGDESGVDGCAEQLAEFFLEKCAEHDMDYDQQADEQWFEEHVLEQANQFLLGWRRMVVAKYGPGAR